MNVGRIFVKLFFFDTLLYSFTDFRLKMDVKKDKWVKKKKYKTK